MNITPDLSVRDVVKSNFKTAPLFQANHIDYCCGGNKPISEACQDAGVDPDQLIRELESISEENDPDSDYINKLSLAELSQYIIKRHHEYIRENIPFLVNSLEKICQVHGDHHPELHEIRKLFLESAQVLPMHLQKEEMVLFPYIQKLEFDKTGHLVGSRAPFGSVANPIEMMLEEHRNEGDRFQEIAKLSDHYRVPEDGCATYEVTLKKLREFEDDLHRHIHLENNILFPKAIHLEAN